MIDPSTRERAVIALLEEWPWELNTTLIGGYAIAAYGAARYSDDIDFVLPTESKQGLHEWLRDRNFVEISGAGVSSRRTFNGATRFSDKEVTVDLLDGRVRDREAGVDVPEAWIAMRRRRTRLDLLSGSVRKQVEVARPEAIWALKLQSGRAQDITDLFAIRREPVSAEEVRTLFETVKSDRLIAKLERVESNLKDPKLYIDSRSRLGLRDSEGARREWTAFEGRVREMLPSR